MITRSVLIVALSVSVAHGARVRSVFPAAQQAGTLVIRHARLVDATATRPRPGTTIIVQHGIIRWVGGDADARLPAGATMLDADGRVVIPGLIDLHQHAASVSPTPGRWLAHGVTSARDPGADLDRARATRALIEDGRLAGPRLFLGLLLDLAPGQTRASVRRLIASEAARGLDLVKLYMRTPAAHAQVAIQEAHARGLPVTWHLSVPLSQALSLGIDEIEHLYVFRELMPPWAGAPPPTTSAAFFELYDRWAQHLDPASDTSQHLFRQLAERGTVWTPTLTLGHRLASGGLALSRNWTPAERATAQAGFAAACRMVGEAAHRGVAIGAGTDTEQPSDLHEELAWLVHCGLSTTSAIRSATLTAARALGQESSLGTVEPGKYADLVVLDADPVRDIRAVTRIWRIIKDGQIYDPAGL